MNHYPVPVLVDTGEEVGGVAITTGEELQLRCGCLYSLDLMYGHEVTE